MLRQLFRQPSMGLLTRKIPLNRQFKDLDVLYSNRSCCSSLFYIKMYNTSSANQDENKVIWPSEISKKLHRRLRLFPRNFEVKKLAIEAGLNPAEWNIVASAFRTHFLKKPEFFFMDQKELDHFVHDLFHKTQASSNENTSTTSTSNPQQGGNLSFKFYPSFLHFAQQNDYIQRAEGNASSFSLKELTDLRLPHEYYPLAANMKRKIIYHEGPTNSGKTYEALERLKKANEEKGGGLYCGPLRLLALEIYEKLNMDGVYTSLVTGQEKKIIPNASHVSCTVEMANINKKWDVAVIDEIQLIGDPQRGWAWTRALFGLQAKEIHVCGSNEAIDLVRKFAQTSGDEFEINSYQRRSPLEIESKALKSYKQIQPGDCVVAFSRKDIFTIKRNIELTTGLQCCIIYGQLPPETRSQQARLFNAKENAFSVLVASDAIGMGLNLNIGRVVFDTVKKYNGSSGNKTSTNTNTNTNTTSSSSKFSSGGGMVDISPMLAKQIAGRAGRFGSSFEKGRVTCLKEEDLEYLKEVYEEKPTQLTRAGLFPSSEQMEEFAKQFPGIHDDLGDLLDKYVSLARLGGDYFLCNHKEIKDAAGLLKEIPLNLSDRFTFCMAPINLRNPLARKLFVEYAKAHSRKERKVQLDIYLPRRAPETAESLRDIEIKAQMIDLYLWLSMRFNTTFVEQELAIEMKRQVLTLVEQGLLNTTYSSGKKNKNKKTYNKQQEEEMEAIKQRAKEMLMENHTTSNFTSSFYNRKQQQQEQQKKKKNILKVVVKEKEEKEEKDQNSSSFLNRWKHFRKQYIQ